MSMVADAIASAAAAAAAAAACVTLVLLLSGWSGIRWMGEEGWLLLLLRRFALLSI